MLLPCDLIEKRLFFVLMRVMAKFAIGIIKLIKFGEGGQDEQKRSR
jgi:hypothetical protein